MSSRTLEPQKTQGPRGFISPVVPRTAVVNDALNLDILNPLITIII